MPNVRRYPRPEDQFKTVGACFRWLTSQPRPTEVTQAVSIVRALYQVGHSTGAPARSIDRAVEVVAKVVRGMAPFGSSVEEVRKSSNERIYNLLNRVPEADAIDVDEYLNRLTGEITSGSATL